MGVMFGISNFDGMIKELEQQGENAKKVIKKTTDDARKRVPVWVAAEVSKVYGIKKAEITGQKVGKVRDSGNRFDRLKFTYTGRALTHTHFSMSPKVPNEGGSYTLKASILKGQRTVLGKVKKLTKKQRKDLGQNFRRNGQQRSDHSPIMLMRANGGHYIPFQRKSHKRNDIEAVKAISLPQMISSQRTAGTIYPTISSGVEKRFRYYTLKYMDLDD